MSMAVLQESLLGRKVRRGRKGGLPPFVRP